MKGFYDITNKLKTHFTADPIVNTVTEGDIFEVDLNKQTIFPLVHLMINNASFETNVVRFNVSLIAMDIVDISKNLRRLTCSEATQMSKMYSTLNWRS
jgi:hypothetical protein